MRNLLPTKKSKSCLAALLLAFVATLAPVSMQAQTTKLHFGIKGGLNITQFSFDEKVFHSDNKNGFFAGPSLYFGVPVLGLGADLSALYNQKKATVGEETIKQQSIDVPFNLRYSFGFSEGACVFVSAGPQASFMLGDKSLSFKSDNDLDEVDWKFENSAFSFNVGGGIVVGPLQLGASYNIPIGKTGEFTWKETADKVFHAHSKSWQISAAIYF